MVGAIADLEFGRFATVVFSDPPFQCFVFREAAMQRSTGGQKLYCLSRQIEIR